MAGRMVEIKKEEEMEDYQTIHNESSLNNFLEMELKSKLKRPDLNPEDVQLKIVEEASDFEHE